MNHPKIFYISTETTQKSHSNMKKTCYEFISSACLLEFLETLHTTQLFSIPLIDLAWVFHWFRARVFVLCLAMKRESSLILRNIRTRYFRGIYVTVSGKCILHKNLSKIINFLVWKSTELNWSVLILFILELWMEDVLHLSKWKKKACLHLRKCAKRYKKAWTVWKKFQKNWITQISKTYLTKHINSAGLQQTLFGGWFSKFTPLRGVSWSSFDM